MARPEGRYHQFTHIHVDCDPLVYKYGFSSQSVKFFVDTTEGAEEFSTLKQAEKYCDGVGVDKSLIRKEMSLVPAKTVRVNLEKRLRQLKNLFKAKRVHLYISPRLNFRNALWDDYKANRSGTEKPHYYTLIREFFEKKGAKMPLGIEADDAVSCNHFHVWVKSPEAKRCRTYETLIVGEDKDFNNVPGWHYNPTKDELFYVTIRDAIRHFYLQLLMGDSADGVPGIPGVGKKKAENMLPPDTTDEGELWAIVKQAYFDYAEKEGINKEEILGTLLVYAHMLWILWEPDKFFIPVDEDEVCQKINSELLNRTKDYLKEIGNS